MSTATTDRVTLPKDASPGFYESVARMWLAARPERWDGWRATDWDMAVLLLQLGHWLDDGRAILAAMPVDDPERANVDAARAWGVDRLDLLRRLLAAGAEATP